MREGYDWVNFSCPFAEKLHQKGTDNKPSFGISIGDRSFFHCFSCNSGGYVRSLPYLIQFMFKRDCKEAMKFLFGVGEYSTNGDYDIDLDKYQREITPMNGAILQMFAKIPKKVVDSFGISDEIIDRYKLLYDKHSRRIIFPIQDKKGRLVGIRGRLVFNTNVDLRSKYISYINLHPSKQDPKTFGIWYLMHEQLIENEPLFLVEGERDALALKQSGLVKNVWASMGANLSVRQKQTLVKQTGSVVLFFDNDVSGRKATQQAVKALRNAKRISIISNYHGVKDPAEAYFKGLLNTVLNSVKTIIER